MHAVSEGRARVVSMAEVPALSAVLPLRVAGDHGAADAEEEEMNEELTKDGRYYLRTAKCPYYGCQFRNNQWFFLECSGIFEGSKRIRHKFRGRRARDRVIETFCCGDFQECPVARAIYEEKEGEE